MGSLFQKERGSERRGLEIENSVFLFFLVECVFLAWVCGIQLVFHCLMNKEIKESQISTSHRPKGPPATVPVLHYSCIHRLLHFIHFSRAYIY